MAIDASGLYLAGATTGTMAGQTSAGSVDAFVRKYDFNGEVVWTRQFGTAKYDDALGIAVSAQGVYIAGNTAGALPGHVNAGDYDVFVRKYDAKGGAVWTQQFGGRAHEELLGIAVDASGVYAAGVTEGALASQRSHGSDDAFVVKLADGAAGHEREAPYRAVECLLVARGTSGARASLLCRGIRHQQAGHADGRPHQDGLGESSRVDVRRRQSRGRHRGALVDSNRRPDATASARVGKDTFPAGIEVTIKGFRARDSRTTAHAETVTLKDGRNFFIGEIPIT